MDLDLKQLVEAITREVVNKLENSKSDNFQNNGNGNLLVASGRVEEGYGQLVELLKGLSCSNIICKWAISSQSDEFFKKNAFNLPSPFVRASDNDVSPEIYNILKQSEILLIPFLTLADAFKIANLIGDSFISKVVLQALFLGKKVIVAPEGIFVSLAMISDKKSSPNSRLNNAIKERMDQLRNIGIEIVSLKSFKEHIGGLLGNVPKTPGGTLSDSCLGNCQGCGHCVARVPEKVDLIVKAGADRIGASPGIKDNLRSEMASMIDHTLLKPDATRNDVVKLCEEARKYKFASVCINPTYVSLSRDLLAGSPVKVCTVIGFPLGADTSVTKAMETRDAIANGADEVDMVINVGALKAKNYDLVRDDIKAVVDSAGGRIVKVILETALLNNEEKIRACELSKEAGADFVKTSTGFGPGGATVEDIALMRKTVGKYMGVKASGGIRDYDKAADMIKAGATRIGASASVAMVEGTKTKGDGY